MTRHSRRLTTGGEAVKRKSLKNQVRILLRRVAETPRLRRVLYSAVNLTTGHIEGVRSQSGDESPHSKGTVSATAVAAIAASLEVAGSEYHRVPFEVVIFTFFEYAKQQINIDRLRESDRLRVRK